jgi:hypothetical protein
MTRRGRGILGRSPRKMRGMVMIVTYFFGRVTGRRRSQLRCAFALRERKYWHHMACFSEAAPDHFRKLAASAAAQAQSSSGAGLCAA